MFEHNTFQVRQKVLQQLSVPSESEVLDSEGLHPVLSPPLTEGVDERSGNPVYS